ncbi:subtilisin-like serine protease [Ceratobasidium sp. 414]|nr:subtilisin-like serine protease [Ceratobasidium sp. 414]
MHTPFLLGLVSWAISSALAAPSVARLPITKRAGPVKPDSYLVKLKPGVSKASHLAAVSSISGSTLSYAYDQAFQGYSIQLQGKALDYVRQSKDVEYVVQDGVVNIQDRQVSLCMTKNQTKTQFWNFYSLDSGAQSAVRRSVRARESHPSKRVGGSGVDIYQIDTYPNADGNGHGTTLASLVVGSTYGPATKANIIAVKSKHSLSHTIPQLQMTLTLKAFDDNGSANLSDIIAGINYVIKTANTTGRPSLILITVTIAGYQPFDDAVASATTKDIHVVVAAGDSNVDASTISPARAASAVTVGAILANGAKLSTSNFGTTVDIWGPGANAKCAWISSPTASVTLVGTTGSAA